MAMSSYNVQSTEAQLSSILLILKVAVELAAPLKAHMLIDSEL